MFAPSRAGPQLHLPCVLLSPVNTALQLRHTTIQPECTPPLSPHRAFAQPLKPKATLAPSAAHPGYPRIVAARVPSGKSLPAGEARRVRQTRLLKHQGDETSKSHRCFWNRKDSQVNPWTSRQLHLQHVRRQAVARQDENRQSRHHHKPIPLSRCGFVL